MRAMHIGPYVANAGPWKRTIELLKKGSNKALTPENLLAISESIPMPDLTPDFDIKSPENRNSAEAKEYKRVLRLKRGILEVRADIQNKFNYFVKTYNRIARKDMNKSVNIYLQKLLNSVGVMFIEDDLGVIIKSFPPDKVGQLEGRVMGWIDTKFNSINPETPEGQSLMNNNNLLGDGSFLTLNQKGINKLLQKTAQDGNWQDLYEQAIHIISQENGKPVEETRKLVAEDDNFSKLFLEQLQNIQEELKKADDFRADFLDVALDKKPKNPPKVGAQQTSTNRISKSQWSVIEFNIDVLESILKLGTDDPKMIADDLNVSRKIHKTIAKGKYNADLVGPWIAAIKSEDQKIQKLKKKKQNRSYQEIYDSTKKELENMHENERLRDAGVPEISTAYRYATLSYMKSPLEYIDPKTNVKFGLVDVPNMFAREGDSDIPINAKTMTELRMNRESKVTEGELKKVLKEEIQKEIGIMEGGMQANKETLDITEVKESQLSENELAHSTSEGESEEDISDTPTTEVPVSETAIPEQEFDITEIPQEKIPPEDPNDPNDPNDPQAPSEEEPIHEEEQPEEFDLKKLFGHTLKSLIVMARDLDSQGKENAAEEIHKIIRKYQGNV